MLIVAGTVEDQNLESVVADSDEGEDFEDDLWQNFSDAQDVRYLSYIVEKNEERKAEMALRFALRPWMDEKTRKMWTGEKEEVSMGVESVETASFRLLFFFLVRETEEILSQFFFHSYF